MAADAPVVGSEVRCASIEASREFGFEKCLSLWFVVFLLCCCVDDSILKSSRTVFIYPLRSDGCLELCRDVKPTTMI